MKVLHTISGMSVQCGGIATCTYDIVKGLRKFNIDADILAFEPPVNDSLIGNDDFIRTVSRPKFIISRSYKKILKESDYQLLHLNGVWGYVENISSKIAYKKNIPYLISPHGMLYPHALKISKWKKRVMLSLSLLKDMERATMIHATCREEMQHLRNLGIKTLVAVIPNPIHVGTESDHASPANDKLRVGYLGRVHPRKNIERLIYAWHNLGEKVRDKELMIIGAGDDTYHHFLKNETKRLKLENVVFTGFLSGPEKDKAIELLSYLVVPSDFENFGMIIPEALIKGIPVIASKGTPWEELNTHRCGWWVENNTDTLTENIGIAINTPESERFEMGQNGKKLVKENYSVEVVAKKMIQLYDWILTGGQKPEFVYT